jgi:hypothetical protein
MLKIACPANIHFPTLSTVVLEKLNIIPWQIISLGGGLKNIKLVFWVYFVVMLKSPCTINCTCGRYLPVCCNGKEDFSIAIGGFHVLLVTFVSILSLLPRTTGSDEVLTLPSKKP